MVKTLVSGNWRWATLLVVVAIGVMVRLAFWQLDRLAERRAFNARVEAQLAAPPLMLDDATPLDGLTEMEYRTVVVRGEFDLAQEVALLNQTWRNQPGAHLLTPLHVAGSQRVVLVDRGWVPIEEAERGAWPQYAETGVIEVRGQIRTSRNQPVFGRPIDPTAVPGERLTQWNLPNVEAMGAQLPYPILPIYIQQMPADGQTDEALPYSGAAVLDLTEGSHLGYAGQWLMFAVVFAVGYPLLVRKQVRDKAARPADADLDDL